MEFTGRLSNVSRNLVTGEYQYTFTAEEASVINQIDDISKCERLSIRAVKYRKKRSLDANAYMWVICSKIAEHPEIHSSKDEVYEEMLQKYGVFFQDEDGNYLPVTVKADVDMSKVPGHWKFYKSNGTFSSYLMIKGTSEYNTAEMAHFIDSVVDE
ncbi:MAG: hypothetical protein IKW21_05440, partial [Lachnospiraceae bacterium]|nr:hypothetical protein [Lachnospiraceae bacterium]